MPDGSVRHAANLPLDERHKRRWPDPTVLIDPVENSDIFADRARVGFGICHANPEAVGPGAQMFGHVEYEGPPRPRAGVDVVDPDFGGYADFPAVQQYALFEQRGGNFHGFLVGHRARKVLQPW